MYLLDKSGEQGEETGVDLTSTAIASLIQELPQSRQHSLGHIHMLTPVLQETRSTSSHTM